MPKTAIQAAGKIESGSDAAFWNDEPDLHERWLRELQREFHLPGEHDQKTHGHDWPTVTEYGGAYRMRPQDKHYGSDAAYEARRVITQSSDTAYRGILRDFQQLRDPAQDFTPEERVRFTADAWARYDALNKAARAALDGGHAQAVEVPGDVPHAEWVRQGFEWAQRCMPAVNVPPPSVRYDAGADRPYYQNETVVLDPPSGARTAIHEYGHHVVEHDQVIAGAEYTQAKKRGDEDYLEPYAARKYAGGDLEVFAVHSELFVAEPVRLAWGDPEMFDWMFDVTRGL